jgi:Domain of unknown function (DUF4440)
MNLRRVPAGNLVWWRRLSLAHTVHLSLAVLCLFGLAFCAPDSAAQVKAETAQWGAVSTDPALNQMFEAKVKAEWEAMKNKDKKAYGELLADDYQGVAVDGRGERNKIQSINDLAEQFAFTYTLERLKVIPLGQDAAFVIYEVTMQYPPRAQLRYSRLYIGELWVKRAGEWKELHYQETHVK